MYAIILGHTSSFSTLLTADADFIIVEIARDVQIT